MVVKQGRQTTMDLGLFIATQLSIQTRNALQWLYDRKIYIKIIIYSPCLNFKLTLWVKIQLILPESTQCYLLCRHHSISVVCYKCGLIIYIVCTIMFYIIPGLLFSVVVDEGWAEFSMRSCPTPVHHLYVRPHHRMSSFPLQNRNLLLLISALVSTGPETIIM